MNNKNSNLKERLVPYEEKGKSRVYLLLIVLTAVVIGSYFWLNVRPKIIYAGCLDVATKSTQLSARFTLSNEENYQDGMLNDCLTNFNVSADIR